MISKVTLFISILILILFTFKVATHPASDNDRSRLAGIISIVRHHELNIGRTEQKITGDRIEWSGGVYSSKPPVLHVALGVFTSLAFSIKPVLIENDVAIYRIATFLTTALPLSLIFILFAKMTNRYASLLLVFGTLLVSYSQYLNNHISEALLQVLLFYLLLKKVNSPTKSLLFGLLISLLFVIDETYGFVAVPISVLYVYFFDWKKDTQYIKWTLIGLFPFTAAHFVLNYIQFKTIFPPPLFLDKYFSYEGSKWVGEPTGYEALDHTWWVRIFNYSFGSHGLFLYQPILIIPFFVKKFWKKKLALYVFSLSAFYIIFNAIMQPNYGGSAFGPRRFLPLIPILFYFVFLSWYQAKYMKLMIILLFIVTLAISFLGYLNPWNNYEIYGRNGSEYYFPIKYTYQKHLRTFYNIKI